MAVSPPFDNRSAELLDLILRRLAEGAAFYDVVGEVRPLDREAHTLPSVELLEVAADALAIGRVSRATPLPVAEISRHWPYEVSGRSHHAKRDHVVRAVAMFHAGLAPDVAEETGWWQLNDLWFHSIAVLCAVVETVASRAGTDPAAIYRELRR